MPPRATYWDSTAQRPSLSSYASTSVSFQHTIERQTFSSLCITTEDLTLFEKFVLQSSTERKPLLRNPTFTPVLPAYDDRACALFDRSADRADNDKVFSDAVNAFFAALSRLDDFDSAGSLCVELDVLYASTDPSYRSERKQCADMEACKLGKRHD